MPTHEMTSIHQLHKQTGLHPKRLRKVLEAAGVLPNGHKGLTDDKVKFSSESAARVVEIERQSLSRPEAAEFLNAPRTQMLLLANSRHLKPGVNAVEAGANVKYATSDLQDFLERLLKNTESVKSADDNRMNIQAAAKRANCSALTIVDAIIAGSLEWTGRLKSERGYLSVLVDIEEIKAFVRGEDHGGISLARVATRLRTNDYVVKALVENGHLKSSVGINPVNKCPQTIVTESELKRFLKKYVSLHALARENGDSMPVLSELIAAHGIKSAFDERVIKASFYLQSEVNRLDL
jgi:hypothetical protein